MQRYTDAIAIWNYLWNDEITFLLRVVWLGTFSFHTIEEASVLTLKVPGNKRIY
jgi:hypothetical protein